MIEAEPDVPDALVHIRRELLPSGAFAQRLNAGLGAENRAASAPILDVLQQAPVCRVDIEQKSVFNRERRTRLGLPSAQCPTHQDGEGGEISTRYG